MSNAIHSDQPKNNRELVELAPGSLTLSGFYARAV